MAEVATMVGVTRQRVHQRVKGIATSRPLPSMRQTITTAQGKERQVIRIARADAEAWATAERSVRHRSKQTQTSETVAVE